MLLYEIRHIDSGKCYIGQTIDDIPNDRWEDHLRRLKRDSHYNTHLQRAWNKYGELAFQFNIVQNVNTKEELDKLEAVFIDQYKEQNKSYNIRSGGSRGGHTKSTKEKISLKLKSYYKKNPNIRSNISKRKLGIKLSDTTKLRMSQAHKRGENHHNVQLTEQQVLEIRQKYIPKKVGLLKLAKEYNVDKKTVLNIIHRKTWVHI